MVIQLFQTFPNNLFSIRGYAMNRRPPLTIWILAAATAICPDPVCGQAPPGPWTQFRGPSGLGISADKDLPTTWSPQENMVWKKEMPGPGSSSPILLGKQLFLTCYTGKGELLKRRVLCLDLDGNILWNKEVKSNLPEQERIRDDHGYATSTPVASADQLFVFFGKSGVHALDHKGNHQWQADVGGKLSDWGSASSPILYKDLVIVNASVESDSLVALDRTNGNEKWRAKGIRESWNTPILVRTPDGKSELIVAILGKVLGFDPDSGEELWSCETAIPWYMAPSLVAHDGIVYAIGGRNPGGALAVRTGGRGDVTKSHRLWTIRKGSNVSSPIIFEGHLYWLNDNQETAYCAEAKSGKIIYEERLPRAGQFYPSPILANGKIFCLSRSGSTFVLAAKPAFDHLATNELNDRSPFNASPAVGGGRLYLRSDRYLYCLGKK